MPSELLKCVTNDIIHYGRNQSTLASVTMSNYCATAKYRHMSSSHSALRRQTACPRQCNIRFARKSKTLQYQISPTSTKTNTACARLGRCSFPKHYKSRWSYKTLAFEFDLPTLEDTDSHSTTRVFLLTVPLKPLSN